MQRIIFLTATLATTVTASAAFGSDAFNQIPTRSTSVDIAGAAFPKVAMVDIAKHTKTKTARMPATQPRFSGVTSGISTDIADNNAGNTQAPNPVDEGQKQQSFSADVASFASHAALLLAGILGLAYARYRQTHQ